MNEKQKQAIELGAAGHNLFVTGGIGTGKTETIHEIVSALVKSGKKVAVTASTGLASKQIKGCDATTLHHWAGLRDSRYTDAQLIELLTNDISFNAAALRIKSTDVLIVDEISMISSKVFQQLEFICRSLRQQDEVFGGMQVIVSGDFMQLKPVPNHIYGDTGSYCFTSTAWDSLRFHTVFLEEVMRQRDRLLIEAIQDLSTGNLTQDSIQYIKSLSRNLPPESVPVYLHARNFDVEMKNYDCLSELDGPDKIYKADDSGKAIFLKTIQVPRVITLRKNCKVMLLVNLSTKLVNGMLGTVVDLESGSCKVNFDNYGTVEVKPYIFTVYSQDMGKNVASREQLPLKLAYAITMHKAQGMSLPCVVVDAEHAYKPGQLATAVGRATCKEGLQVINFNSASVQPQPKEIMEFQKKSCGDRLLHADKTCCRIGRLNKDVREDFPLGADPICFDPEDDFDDEAMIDDTEDAHGENTDDVESDNDDVELFLQQVDSYKESVREDEPLPEMQPPPASIIPKDVNLELFREEVQDEFIDAETPEQQRLSNKDNLLTNEKLHLFIAHLWQKMDIEFQSVEKKGYGNIEHREFAGFMKFFHKYQESQEYAEHMKGMLSCEPDNTDKRLMYKYALKLIHTFLVYKESALREQGASSSGNQMAPVDRVDASEASKAAIRYLAGLCFAKARHKQCQIALNNVYKPKEVRKVSAARLRVSLLQQHIVPQSQIEKSSELPKTLTMIMRKQNARLSLTHITDEVFKFFQGLDTELSLLLTKEAFRYQKGELFVLAERTIMKSDILRKEWEKLFITYSVDEKLIHELMVFTIKTYIHIRCNQFRKDSVDELRDFKSLEVRKDLWTRKRQSASSKSAGTKSRKTTSIRMDDILNDKTPRLEKSHKMLKTSCLMEGSCVPLTHLSKENLKLLSRAYGIQFTSKWTKEKIIQSLRDKVVTLDDVPHPEVLSGEYSQHSVVDENLSTVCPLCKEDYPDYSMWVGCDNESCNAFVCRKCADLEDDQDYENAVADYWQCPLCK